MSVAMMIKAGVSVGKGGISVLVGSGWGVLDGSTVLVGFGVFVGFFVSVGGIKVSVGIGVDVGGRVRVGGANNVIVGFGVAKILVGINVIVASSVEVNAGVEDARSGGSCVDPGRFVGVGEKPVLRKAGVPVASLKNGVLVGTNGT